WRGGRPRRRDRDSGRSAEAGGASAAGQIPEDRLRRLVHHRVEVPKAEKEDGHQDKRAVSLEAPPGVRLARRQERIDDAGAVERGDRNEIEETEDDVVENDALEDREIHATAHVYSEAQRDRAKTGDREVRERSRERDRGPRGPAALQPRLIHRHGL